MEALESDIRKLACRLESLSREVDRLRGAVDDAQETVRRLGCRVIQLDPEIPEEPEEPEEPEKLAAWVKEQGVNYNWYAVIKPRRGFKGQQDGKAAVYKGYRVFADQLRDHSVDWGGKGNFTWAPGTQGRGFHTKQEVRDYFKKRGWEFDLEFIE